MKRFSMWSLVIVLGLVAGVSANAADFKGFYVGVNVGPAYGNSDVTTSTVFSPTGYFATTSVPAIGAAGIQNLAPTRLTGGAQAGFNIQGGAWVLGLEGDMGSMHLDDSASATQTYPCCAPTSFTVNQKITTSWLFTLRPRAGFTSGPVLFYGTGGLAVTDRRYAEIFSDTFATAAESANLSNNVRGWTYGGGVEFKPGKFWSFKGEYLHLAFGSESVTSTNLTAFSPPIAFPTNVFTHTANLTANLARFGINFHF